MFYFVCFQNCLEDYYYYENAPSIRFETFEAAKEYVSSLNSESSIPVFEKDGGIRWFFPSCQSDGSLDMPSEDLDILDCYQIINIIPSEEQSICISESYSDDPKAIMVRSCNYLLNYLGKISIYDFSKIRYTEE